MLNCKYGLMLKYIYAEYKRIAYLQKKTTVASIHSYIRLIEFIKENPENKFSLLKETLSNISEQLTWDKTIEIIRQNNENALSTRVLY